MHIARIAVENTAYHFDQAFDYSVPDALLGAARPGCRALVPFGTHNAGRQGMILEQLEREPPEGVKLKPILSVLDEDPLLTEEALRMVPWLKEHTFCTLFEAVRLFLPIGILMKLRTEYSLSKDAVGKDRGILTDSEARIVEYLAHCGAVRREKLLNDLGLSSDSSLPDRLAAAGWLKKSTGPVRMVGDATEKMVRFQEPAGPLPRLTPRQKGACDVLRDAGCASVKELCYFAGVTASVVDALAEKGLAEYYDAEVYRTPYGSAPQPAELSTIDLTEDQEKAFQNLYRQYRSGGGVSLLYGVTGSGKTSVFTRLIDRVVEEGRGVIVMVPEISLTPQTISLFRARYGSGVAVFHSGLSMGERLDEWKRVNRGEARVVVGTRSAVFAPFHELGLIIMDEEQEGTYKSESSPRYHAREAAKFRCAYHKALLVLSSATPSVESYCRALSGRYGLSVLPERYGPAKLPHVTVVDMNLEPEGGSAYSAELAGALADNLKNGRQSILLLNRRGYHTFVSCRACGEVLTCPNCSISLTYHAANHRLMCHYCGFSMPFAETCPSCGAKQMRYSGCGTQRALEQLQELLPEARILRLDADSTMTRFAYDKMLHQFSEGEYDIIVGTQMVAKGLDFENVTLVGVLSADQALYGEDYRSYERAFDLLTQVVGRSGRGQYEGRAIIQTYTPENNIIRLAAKQDYEGFYRGEIAFRQTMLYPPFADICVVGFTGRIEKKVRAASENFLTLLRETARREYPEQPMRVLSPSPASVGKVSNKYRYKLIIKCRNNKRVRKMLSELLLRFSAQKDYSDVSAFADMNPETIL